MFHEKREFIKKDKGKISNRVFHVGSKYIDSKTKIYPKFQICYFGT